MTNIESYAQARISFYEARFQSKQTTNSQITSIHWPTHMGGRLSVRIIPRLSYMSCNNVALTYPPLSKQTLMGKFSPYDIVKCNMT